MLLYGGAGVAALLPSGARFTGHVCGFVAALALAFLVGLVPEAWAMFQSTPSMVGRVKIAQEIAGLILIFLGMFLALLLDVRASWRPV